MLYQHENQPISVCVVMPSVNKQLIRWYSASKVHLNIRVYGNTQHVLSLYLDL